MNKRFFLLAGFAAILAISCNKALVDNPEGTDESQEQTPEVQLVHVTLNATSENASKATIDGDYQVLWQEGDKLAVFDGQGKREFTLASGAGTKSAVFEGDIDAGATGVTAIYPFSAATNEGAAVLPVDQEVTAAGGHNLVMTATAEVVNGVPASLDFEAASSLYKFTVGAGVNHLVLHSIPNEANGGVCASLTGNSPYISVKFPEVTEGTATYAIAVPSGEFPAFRVFWGKDNLPDSNDEHTKWKMLESTSGRPNAQGRVFDLGNLSTNAKAKSVTVIDSRDDIQGTDGGGNYTHTQNAYVIKDFVLGRLGNKIILNNAVLDGQGHTITGVNENQAYYACLFDSLTGASVLKNIVFGTADAHGSMIQTETENTYAIGGIVRWLANTSSLKNITSYVDVESKATQASGGSFIAGILAQNRSTGKIENCKNYGSVTLSAATSTGNVFVGGIVAQTTTAISITNCLNDAVVTNRAVATADGETSPKTVYVGGIVGAATGATTMNSCINWGKILNYGGNKAGTVTTVSTGGIVGYLKGANSSLTSCSTEATWDGTAKKWNPSADVTDGSNSMEHVVVGSIVGTVAATASITGCNAKGLTQKTNDACKNLHIGGIVGYNNGGKVTISNCTASRWVGSAQNVTSNMNAGGIVGYINGVASEIRNCTSSGGVSTNTKSKTYSYLYMGGIVGRFDGAGKVLNCTLSNSVTNGTSSAVTTVSSGSIRIGGMIGSMNKNVTVQGCTVASGKTLASYSTSGVVTYIGGLVGFYNTTAGALIDANNVINVTVSHASTGTVGIASVLGRCETNVSITNNRVSGKIGANTISASNLYLYGSLYNSPTVTESGNALYK